MATKTAVQCPECGVRRNQHHRKWCSQPPMMELPEAQTEPPKARSVQRAGSVQGPFELYRDEVGTWHIIDADQRIILTDNFAYDACTQAGKERMEWVVSKLNAQNDGTQRWRAADDPIATETRTRRSLE